MDQVQSLINRLTRQVAADVHSAELLTTIEMLRQEIVKSSMPEVKHGQAVCVWMPGGMNLSRSNGHSAVVIESNGHQNGHVVAQPAVRQALEEIPKSQLPEQKREDIPTPPSVPSQVYAAPRPPVITASVEKLPEPELPQPVPKVEEKPAQEEFILDSVPDEDEISADLPYRPKPAEPNPVPAAKPSVEEFPAPEINHAYIKVQELAAARHAKMDKPEPAAIAVAEKPFSKFAGIDTAVKNHFPVATPPAPRKEINELVLDPAIPLNQKLKASHTELGDVLANSGSRVTDLKKAFAINERFQLINGLFRGDDDMFDRSIRTLNNFGNYQEASYWMQRELVIKLGWNEDEELVQHFYRILSRRF